MYKYKIDSMYDFCMCILSFIPMNLSGNFTSPDLYLAGRNKYQYVFYADFLI